ncbi:glycosyltransferase [Falsiroseomonas selenitidurans]|uniref:Glycosyltransferase family 4 protein n=1 Tax=Falsiroseomonas selenitidurans TaxID=2716335 RepID=A0ABX1E5Y1_9PROT|nr:glycosyltransferase [Falsiroseomonas selenitidurans]NKC32376.1 glycosyltransferase family 4 protein [Falsiroseomonas selenitidurans]
MTAPGPPAASAAAPGRQALPLVLMLSAAHPPQDVRIVVKEGAALAAAGLAVCHLAPAHLAPAPPPRGPAEAAPMLHGVAIAAYEAPRSWLGRLRGVPALARRAAVLRPAVIHAHEPDSWLAALLAARRCGARCVLDVHEHYPSRLDTRLPRPLRPLARAALRGLCRVAAARADAVVVAKDGLDADFGGAARCTAVRNYASPVPVVPRRHRAGPLRLLHLGALGAARGALLMPAVLARLPQDTTLCLLGRFTDGSEKAFYARARALGVEGRIEALGWMAREAALTGAAGCDIGLVLFQPGVENHRLALPHKLFDCMLAGLPVIVPDFAEEVREVVRQAGCGLAVDVADPGAIARAVLSLADPAQRAALGARGRAAALGRFGWSPEAARLVRLYRRLLAPAPAAAPSLQEAVRAP